MNHESLELLEYPRLRALVARYVASDAGRALVGALEPSTDRAQLEHDLAEAAEALALLKEAAQPKVRGEAVKPRFEGLPDVGQAVARLRIGGSVLEASEIADLLTLLDRALAVRTALSSGSGAYPLLAARSSRIGDFRPMLRELSGKILPDGSVADDASPTLARIRRDMERQRRVIHESLQKFLTAHRDDGLLQEEFITIRNERFVVPVIPGAKRKLPGVVHGASGSGHTLFLEPMEAIEQNNELVRLTEEEQREVHRILREMTARLREQGDEIRLAAEILAALDIVFAKARFAVDFECVIPTFSPEGSPKLTLREARHPLLQDVLKRHKKRVVPVSLELDGHHNTLLISGPNTGGKTVTMKTAGLLVLMAQSALPVPAEALETPLFEDVLADIGDNQSIEQSLSSFGSHVARVKEMVDEARPGVLVLLDELGRATDPEEGGALGVAILEEFRQLRAFTFASTHLLPLKVYGANTPGVVNASMGFNEETLEPTYVLRTGSPGKSAGLDIASRLGLPPRLIDRARSAMSSTERDIAAFLALLETKIGEAAALKDSLASELAALEERERKLEKQMLQRETERLREFEKRSREAQEIFDKEAKEAIGAVMAAPEQRKQAERALRQVARTQRQFEESVQALDPRKKQTVPAAPKDAIVEGARVRLRDVSGPARVRRVLPNGILEVDVGLLKMQISASEVTEVLPDAATGGSSMPAGVKFTPGPRFDTLTREVNVIGKTADDARDEVERFLDSAALAGVMHVRIIHGHGMGVLRRMVQELLKGHPLVEKHYPASPADGGTGATIAELKEN